MIIQLTQTPFIGAYQGCGGYLVALAGEELRGVEKCSTVAGRKVSTPALGRRTTKTQRAAAEAAWNAARESFDAQVRAFSAAHPGARVRFALGSCTELIVLEPYSSGHLYASDHESACGWRVVDLIGKEAA